MKSGTPAAEVNVSITPFLGKVNTSLLLFHFVVVLRFSTYIVIRLPKYGCRNETAPDTPFLTLA
jgi:hypothetical protein